jgi:hypothetical protein
VPGSKFETGKGGSVDSFACEEVQTASARATNGRFADGRGTTPTLSRCFAVTVTTPTLSVTASSRPAMSRVRTDPVAPAYAPLPPVRGHGGFGEYRWPVPEPFNVPSAVVIEMEQFSRTSS